MKARYGVDSMPETAENVAQEFDVSRADQDAFALRSQQRAAAAIADGPAGRGDRAGQRRAEEGRPDRRDRDEHPRDTTLEALAKLKGVVRPDGTVTAGNASGINDGACALLLASEDAAKRYGLTPRARVVARRRCRRRAAHHGLRSGARDAEGARARAGSTSPTWT